MRLAVHLVTGQKLRRWPLDCMVDVVVQEEPVRSVEPESLESQLWDLQNAIPHERRDGRRPRLSLHHNWTGARRPAPRLLCDHPSLPYPFVCPLWVRHCHLLLIAVATFQCPQSVPLPPEAIAGFLVCGTHKTSSWMIRR